MKPNPATPPTPFFSRTLRNFGFGLAPLIALNLSCVTPGDDSTLHGGGSGASAGDKNRDNIVDVLGVGVDSDGDGFPDGFDVNGDGVVDGAAIDTNGDGIPDAAGLDTDGDGIIDALDTDGDGVADLVTIEPTGAGGTSAATGGTFGSGGGTPSGASGGTPTGSGGSPVPTDLTFVRAQGHDVIDANGQKIMFRGVNLGGWLLLEGYLWHVWWPSDGIRHRTIDARIEQALGPQKAAEFWRQYRQNFITSADMKRIRAMGLNVVRLPLNARLMMDEGSGALIESGFVDVQRAIDLAKAEDLYVILDMHAAPGGQTGDTDIDDSPSQYRCPELYGSQLYQDRLTALWRAIADRWSDERAVAAYDLLNEPIAWKDSLWAECGADDWQTDYIDRYVKKLWPIYERLKNEIRQVDGNHMLMVQGYGFGSEPGDGALNAPFDDNMAYSFHYYAPAHELDINKYNQYRNQWNRPFFVGEFGEDAGKESHVNTLINSFESNNMGWTMWTWKRMQSGGDSPIDIPNPDGWGAMESFIAGDSGAPGNSEALLWDFLEKMKFSNCYEHSAMVNVLAR